MGVHRVDGDSEKRSDVGLGKVSQKTQGDNFLLAARQAAQFGDKVDSNGGVRTWIGWQISFWVPSSFAPPLLVNGKVRRYPSDPCLPVRLAADSRPCDDGTGKSCGGNILGVGDVAQQPISHPIGTGEQGRKRLVETVGTVRNLAHHLFNVRLRLIR